ncbi:hypothetical protein ABIF63_000045 [Bradyrhizobium japonicum]|uniref:Uncharacterized protein n=1 Tax=Bradyrhizobium japonicum TaxID=375 RepID=A0ABV2RGL9_BRAJP
MSYALIEVAKAVVASAADFVTDGRVAPPPVAVEGLWDEVLDSQKQYDAAVSAKPVTIAVVDRWRPAARIAWMMNVFQTDHRYASGWSIARRAMADFPVEFSQALDRLWHERAAKNWRGSSV